MIVFGKQSVLYILQHAPDIIEEIYFSKEIERGIFNQFARLKKPILKIDNKKAQALAKGGNHQGFFLKIRPPLSSSLADIKMMDRIVVLCGITDVGNIGSIIRSAYALGIDGIVLCGVKNIALEGVFRSSVGSLLHMPFCIIENALDVIATFKDVGIKCLGADMDGERIEECKIDGKWALFLGSEGDGLGRKIMGKLDTILSIKMREGFHSLNVGVAAGILMYGLKG